MRPLVCLVPHSSYRMGNALPRTVRNVINTTIMKKTLFLAGISILLLCCQKPVETPQVSKGQLDTYPAFASQFIQPRTVRVWTPSNYDPSIQYDVLYMHDGQMLWDTAFAWNKQEWGVDEALDSLIAKKTIRPTIVVGIDNSVNRIGEYCPDDISLSLPESYATIYADIQAQGNDYLRFIVEELKPFIDSVYSTYPTREHTFVMGSSCGGLISSYAVAKYPEVFGGAACLSTHCTLAFPDPTKQDSILMKAYRDYLAQYIPTNGIKLYMDNGDQTLDANYIVAQTLINQTLWEKGWDEAHFMYRFFPTTAHTETDWRARLDIPLTFLLASE